MRIGSAIVALLVLLVAPQTAVAEPSGRLSVTVLSGRPDTVTGGDALVRVAAPAHVPLDRIRVRVDGRDVTARFRPDPDVHGVTALVDGLRRSTITATAPGVPGGAVTVVDHSGTGPVFSGPHEQPFVCETTTFA